MNICSFFGSDRIVITSYSLGNEIIIIIIIIIIMEALFVFLNVQL